MTKGAANIYFGMIDVLSNNQISFTTIIDVLYDLDVYDELENTKYADLLIWVDKSFDDAESRFDVITNILNVLPSIEEN